MPYESINTSDPSWKQRKDRAWQSAVASLDKQVSEAFEPTEFSATWNPNSIAIGGMEAKTVTAAGAELGDYVMASFSLDVTDLILTANVTAADLIVAVLSNNTAGAVDLDSGTLRVRLIKTTV